jgi:hypothetical protein
MTQPNSHNETQWLVLLSIYFDPHHAGIGLRQWLFVNFYQLCQRITQSATDRNRTTNRNIILGNSSRQFWCRINRSPPSETIKTWTCLIKKLVSSCTRFLLKSHLFRRLPSILFFIAIASFFDADKWFHCTINRLFV